MSIGAGLTAGRILRDNYGPTSAASSNITVANNDKSISHDQSTGTTTIVQTSIVTVQNSEANYGYALKAKIGQNTMTGSSVTMGSANYTECSVADPCALNNTTPTTILATDNNNATTTDGDTTTFTVTITIPADMVLSDYILDIEYTEHLLYTPYIGLIDGTNIQDSTRAQCDNTPPGLIVNLKDARDGTYYRVKKMVDGNCWMIDDLAYDLNRAVNPTAPAYSPAILLGGVSTDLRAQYVQHNNIAGQGQIPNNGNPKASFLYNWCATLGDTSNNCTASKNAADLQTVLNSTATTTATATNQPEVQGICPTPLHLPKGGPDASTANTANEFAKLDIAMGGTGINRTSANTFSNFVGTTTDKKDWHGNLSGYYYSGMNTLGVFGVWWTSTADTSTYTYFLSITSTDPYDRYVYPASYTYRTNSFPVRCLF